MGSDVTPNGLRFQFTDRFRPVAKRQLEILEAGGDPKDVDLNTGGKGSKGQNSSGFIHRILWHIFPPAYLVRSFVPHFKHPEAPY